MCVEIKEKGYTNLLQLVFCRSSDVVGIFEMVGTASGYNRKSSLYPICSALSISSKCLAHRVEYLFGANFFVAKAINPNFIILLLWKAIHANLMSFRICNTMIIINFLIN